MLYLHTSNSVEQLVEGLVETLRQVRQRDDRDVLTPTVLIIPNRQVDTFLKFTIARKTGIAANLRTLFLRHFIETLLPQEPVPMQLLDRQILQGLILRVLASDDLSQNAELRPVWEYVMAAGQREDDVDLRRFQLSAQLARLFQEYDLTRPDMLQRWRQSKTLYHGAHAAMETWQRAIWLRLFGPDGERDKLAMSASVKRISASELGCATTFDLAAVPAHVHIFGLSYVARTYHRLFARLAQQTELHLYVLAPWHVDLAPDEIAPMLQLWGRPGSDNLKLLREVGIDQVIADAGAPAKAVDTALHRLQQAVFTGSMPLVGDTEVSVDDPSWCVLACPSIRREVEIVANEIWSLVMEADVVMEADIEAAERLRFHDIAVIVAAQDQQTYQTHIAAVFKACHDIPLTMIDVPVAAQSGFVEAVGWLLTLPFSSFNRQAVLPLLTHPAFLSRLPDVDAAEWLTWCQQLAIVHGADREAHAETYIRRDLFNWEQGSRRLLLGTFMSGSRSGEKRAFELGDTAYLPQEFSQDRLGNAASFALIVRSLIADARFCQTAQLSLVDWAGFLSHLLTAYLDAPVESDEPYVSQCLQLVQELEQCDCDGQPVSYRIAYEFVNAALQGIESRQGDYLSGGVVVSSFQPMRSIPFRAVFVVGMGEGKFPAADRDDPLDIRQAQPRPGDVSLREQDLYMFLETLISTRERLYLSYVGRDEQTGETLPPSSVIQELLAFTGGGMTAPETVSQRVLHHPLTRYDRGYFPELFPQHYKGLTNVLPAAWDEAQIVALRDDLQQFCRTHNRPFPSLDELQTELDPKQWNRLQDRLGLVAVPAGLVGDGLPLSRVSGQPVAVSLSSLRQFLYCPLQAWARLHLGLRREGDDDWIDCEDEPFDTSRWVASRLLRETFLEKWSRDVRDGGDVPFDPIYDIQAAYEELAGRLPTGFFLEAERTKHLRLLARWQANLNRHSFDGLGELKVVQFGRAEEHAAVDDLLNPIVVEVDFPSAKQSELSIQVELHGRTEAISQSLPGSLTLLAGQKPAERDVLRGFFDHVIMSATQGEPAAPYHGIVNATEAIQTTVFKPISAAEATAYLHDLVGDFLGQSHAYLMPVEAVLQYRNPRSKRSLNQIVGALCDNPWASMSSRYGPVPFPERYALPSEAEADRMIERRFGLFFDKQMTR